MNPVEPTVMYPAPTKSFRLVLLALVALLVAPLFTSCSCGASS